MKHWTTMAVLGVAFISAGCGLGKREPDPPLNGAGSTFVYPLLLKWSAEYEKTEGGCKIDYEETGSGRGIAAVLKKRVDFACSDGDVEPFFGATA